MNEAGARREPFLFGVDFELSEGFFVSDPLGQQEILFEAGGVTNSPVREGMPGEVSERVFSPNPVAYEVYREKFAAVREGLARRFFFVEPDGGNGVGDGLDVGRDFPPCPVALPFVGSGAICLFLAGDFRAGGRGGDFFLPDEGND